MSHESYSSANGGGTLTTSATRIDTEKLVRCALRTDANDRFYQAAFNKLTRSITRPGKSRRWIFDQAAHGTYKPWRALTEPMTMAMDAGASEEDVMAIVHCLAGLVHAHYAGKECETATVKEALRLAINTEADEVVAQANALADPSDSNIERVLEATTADDRADRTLLTLCQTRLAARVTK